MKRNNAWKISVLLFACILVACSGFDSDQKVLNQPVEISLNPYVGRLVTVKAVADGDTLNLLFDTGGGETFIGPDIARRLGCTPSGRSIGFRMTGEKIESRYCQNISLEIGGVTFHHDMIGVWDINSILPENLPPLDGILSLKTFSDQPFTLDLASKSLILESEKSIGERTSAMTRLESRIANGTDGSELNVFLYGKIEDYGWFLLDSGNLDVVLVSRHLDFSKLNDSTSNSSTWESEFSLKNLTTASTKFRTKEIIYDGALSEEFIRKWIFSFDLSDNAVWAVPVENTKLK